MVKDSNGSGGESNHREAKTQEILNQSKMAEAKPPEDIYRGETFSTDAVSAENH